MDDKADGCGLTTSARGQILWTVVLRLCVSRDRILRTWVVGLATVCIV